MKTYTMKLTDLKPLEQNPNKGSERGDHMLEKSLEQGGIGRSIVIADNGEILAGNHVFEQVGTLFEDQDIIVVETEGDRLVAVRRKDLPDSSDPRSKALIIGDNRASDFHDYDIGVLEALSKSVPHILEGFWHEEELSALLDSQGGEDDQEEQSILLAATHVTLDDPVHVVSKGDIWAVGHHYLICCNVMTDVEVWQPYLKKTGIFIPYPGAFVGVSKKAIESAFLMVQPDPYIAGHIIDRYCEAYPDHDVRKIN